ncbi:hypothetical protein IWW34DRAFT_721704 [Fusarium oxysporum f. sp. albedinis]|nr:hypothetical protein IWW34DRAFT_721704 [Fusarium oxysporum f. sp. albedinis]
MRKKTDIATRALVVYLKSPFGGKTTAEITEITGLPVRTVNGIYLRSGHKAPVQSRRGDRAN